MTATDSFGKDVSAKELKKRDFILHGNLWKVVFVIAFPLFLFELLNYAYSIVDTIMCTGISKAAVNAVGALTQVNNMIAAIGGGLSAGGSILIAREIGKGDYRKAQRMSTSLFTYTALIGIVTMAVILPLAAPILRLLNISEESIEVGLGYFMISVVSSTIIMINTVFMGVEKAKGSTIAISLLNVGVVVLKIALNALFLYGFSIKDMTYVSLSTLLANGCLLLFILIRIFRKSYVFRFRFRDIDFRGKIFAKTMHISFPIFLGKFVFSLGKVVVNALAGTFDNPDVVGALGVSNNMGGSVTNPISSIEDSTSSIISQNIGGHEEKRAIKTFFIGLLYALGIAIVGVTLISIFNDPITLFFARNAGSDEDIKQFAAEISQVFFYEKMGIITLAINSAVLGLLYGFAYTGIASVLNIARVFVFRIPSFLVCEYLIKDADGNSLDGFQVAGISMGFSNIAIGITAIIVASVVLMKITKRIKIKEKSMKLTEAEKKQTEDYLHSYLQHFVPYKNGMWCYEDGIVLSGAYQLYRATREKVYLDFCQNYYEKAIGEDGSLPGYDPKNHALDDIQPGYALLLLSEKTSEPKFEKAVQRLQTQLQEQPHVEGRAYIHKEKYPDQVWLDGLYMAEPFASLCAVEKHSRKDFATILTHFKMVEEKNRCRENGFYYHAYDAKKAMPWADKESGRSPNVWLRSVGWLAMADCDVASIGKEQKIPYETGIVQRQLQNVLSSLAPYEDPLTHAYYDLPLLPKEKGNYLETSGSLMIAYAYLKGARVGILPFADLGKGADILVGVIRKALVNDHLEGIVQVSGLDDKGRDGSVGYYLQEPVVSDDAKGVAPLMMAYSEYRASIA
jgi:rhamnogalacturonyl hydrolase YesR/Na+-driven multidrug efflux pump